MTDTAPAKPVLSLTSLKPSARMPVLFLGHGSPMNAIEDNAYRQSWQALGPQILRDHGRPQLILCISAHWLTHGWWLTAMERPKTIHDFGGFPPELFAQNYPVPGAPSLAQEISQKVSQPGLLSALALDLGWGLDHGSWSVLKPMFPAADIPVIQLSIDYAQAMTSHFDLGRQLRHLRDHGVLIVGSGNLVHNLRTMQFGTAPNQAYDWAVEFDKFAAACIDSGHLEGLQDFQKLGTVAKQAHPTFEHYLPVLYTAGAAYADEKVRSFNTDFQAASISMRSVVWG